MGHRGKTEAERNCLCSLLIFVVFSEEISFFFFNWLFVWGMLNGILFFLIVFKFFVYSEIFIGIILLNIPKYE